MKNLQSILLFVSLLLCLFFAEGTFAETPPGLPTAYYGELIINGESAPVGVVVTAWIDGVKYSESIVRTPGYYGLLAVSGDIDDTDMKEGGVVGDQVTFKINGVDAPVTAEWLGEGVNSYLDIFVESDELVFKDNPVDIHDDKVPADEIPAVASFSGTNSVKKPVQRSGELITGNAVLSDEEGAQDPAESVDGADVDILSSRDTNSEGLFDVRWLTWPVLLIGAIVILLVMLVIMFTTKSKYAQDDLLDRQEPDFQSLPEISGVESEKSYSGNDFLADEKITDKTEDGVSDDAGESEKKSLDSADTVEDSENA